MQRTRNRERNAEVMKAHGQRKHGAVRDTGETEEEERAGGDGGERSRESSHLI